MKSIIAGVVRHFITTGGGAGALAGVTTDDPILTTIGVIAIVGGMAWSAIQKLVD